MWHGHVDVWSCSSECEILTNQKFVQYMEKLIIGFPWPENKLLAEKKLPPPLPSELRLEHWQVTADITVAS